jgi:nicotinamide mononucleotide (NMN) deamidase PncC
VHFACAARGERPKLLEKRFGDIGRAEVRQRSVEVALELLGAAALEAPGRP